MGDWWAGGGVAGLFAAALMLIWRVVRLGVDQEDRLLKPAYDRIASLEKRIGCLEEEQRQCQRQRAQAFHLLRLNGIPMEGIQ